MVYCSLEKTHYNHTGKFHPGNALPLSESTCSKVDIFCHANRRQLVPRSSNCPLPSELRHRGNQITP